MCMCSILCHRALCRSSTCSPSGWCSRQTRTRLDRRRVSRRDPWCKSWWCSPPRAWLLSAAVFAAMRRFKFCAAGASCKLARSVCAVLLADATCFSTGGAAFLLAHCPAATAVFGAQPPCLRLGGAAVDRAGLAAMCLAELAFATGYARAHFFFPFLFLPPNNFNLCSFAVKNIPTLPSMSYTASTLPAACTWITFAANGFACHMLIKFSLRINTHT